ncbi:sialidase family protein, partial [Victivallis lenta]
MKPAFTLRRVLQLPPKPGNPRNSEGGFVTLRDGRILFVYTRYCGESRDDHAPAELAARISTDGGRSYLPDERIIVPNEGRNVMSVSLLRLADGRIALVYLRKSGGDACDCRPYLRTSSDEGESWSAPADIIGLPGYFVVNNDRLIQLSSGRLLLPAAFHRYCRNAQGRVEPG